MVCFSDEYRKIDALSYLRVPKYLTFLPLQPCNKPEKKRCPNTSETVQWGCVYKGEATGRKKCLSKTLGSSYTKHDWPGLNNRHQVKAAYTKFTNWLTSKRKSTGHCSGLQAQSAWRSSASCSLWSTIVSGSNVSVYFRDDACDDWRPDKGSSLS